MPAYHYVAVNVQGVEQKGVVEADSEKAARQLLRNQSLIPLTLRVAQTSKRTMTKSTRAWWGRSPGLGSQDTALFTRQFATLLAAGLPVEEALAAVGEQSEKQQVKGLILSVRGKVMEGHSLAAALREYPNAFSPLFCATVAAGEKSGHLDKVLLRLADYTEQQANMRQKLRTALIYPTVIVLVALGIVGFLLEYVVPKMIAVYSHLNQALPFLTRVLIGMSQLLKQYGLIILLLMIGFIYVWYLALQRSPAWREKTHRVWLRMPIIGKVIKTANTARFSRTLSILSASGVPVMEAMTIAAQLITNIAIRQAVEVAVLRVREGASLHLALKQTGYFSPMSVHMVASGEASGQLEAMLERVATTQENDITRLIDVSLALFEPAMILVMGIVVLFIVLAVLLPIFQLNQFTG